MCEKDCINIQLTRATVLSTTSQDSWILGAHENRFVRVNGFFVDKKQVNQRRNWFQRLLRRLIREVLNGLEGATKNTALEEFESGVEMIVELSLLSVVLPEFADL